MRSWITDLLIAGSEKYSQKYQSKIHKCCVGIEDLFQLSSSSSSVKRDQTRGFSSFLCLNCCQLSLGRKKDGNRNLKAFPPSKHFSSYSCSMMGPFNSSLVVFYQVLLQLTSNSLLYQFNYISIRSRYQVCQWLKHTLSPVENFYKLWWNTKWVFT